MGETSQNTLEASMRLSLMTGTTICIYCFIRDIFLSSTGVLTICLAEEVRKSRSLNAEKMKEELEADARPGHNTDEDEQFETETDMTLDNKENTSDQSSGSDMATDTEKKKDKGKQKATHDSDAARDQHAPPPPRLSDYELQKLANIAKNKQVLDTLLPQGTSNIFGKKEKVKRTRAPKEQRNVELTERRTRSMKGYVVETK